MNISDKMLRDTANVYVKNGILVKYRYGAFNVMDIGKELTEQELEEIKTMDKVIIESDSIGAVEFFNFTGRTYKYK